MYEIKVNLVSVHKTVQHWLPEVDWPSLHEKSGARYKKINFPILWKLNKKITLATQFHTKFQTSGRTYIKDTILVLLDNKFLWHHFYISFIKRNLHASHKLWSWRPM